MAVRKRGTTEREARVRRKLGLAGSVLILALIAGAAGLVGVYRATQQVPAFYEEALAISPRQQEEAGYELEQNVLDLHNDVQALDAWESLFSEDQLNGWLAADLPRKFPAFLPPEIRAPRVNVEDGRLSLACRYEGRSLSTVVHLQLDVYLANEPNTLAIRLRKARAGNFPLPLKSFLDHISATASQLSLPVRWTQLSGDPVALITLPSQFDAFPGRTVAFEVVELRPGEVRVAGNSSNSLGREGPGTSPADLQTADDPSGRNDAVQR